MHNKIYFKKILILILILAMAITPIAIAQDPGNYTGTEFYNEYLDTNSDRAWFDDLKALNIISSAFTYSIKVNGSTLYANKQIFDHLGLMVYGDHSLVAKNDFKAKSTGYYKKNGKSGEYRYEGYSFNGVIFANQRFPKDADSGRELAEKTWIYKPWEEASKGYKRIDYNLENPSRASKYNRDVVAGFDNSSGELKTMYSHLVSQINDTAPFQIEKAAYTVDNPGADAIKIDGNRDMINYGIVQQPPSSYASGSVFLTHYNYDGEAVTAPTWYQISSLNRLEEKLNCNLDGGLTVLDKTYHKETGTWTYTLGVYALVDDNFIYDGTLETEIFEYFRQAYVNREDLKTWDLSLTTNEGLILSSDDITNSQNIDFGKMEKTFLQTHVGDKVYGANAASKTINVSIHESELDKLSEGGDINFKATATATYFLKKDNVYQKDSIILGDMSSGNMPPLPPVEPEPVDLFEVDVTAPKEIIDAWAFDLKQNIIDGSALESIEVILDGQTLNDSEQALFLSGNYQFPRSIGDKLYRYRINYITSLMMQDEEGELTEQPIDINYESYVIVYDPTPRIDVNYENYGKTNRRIVVEPHLNSMAQFVMDNTNTKIDIFNVNTPEDIGIRYAENSTTKKAFLVKEPGTIDIHIMATNEYASSTYNNNIYQMADLRPDIVAMIWNNNLARGETLNILTEATSVDGDTLEAMPYEVWYGKEEGNYTEKVYEGIWEGSTDYMPTKLGYYEITWSVKEVFGQPTYEAFVTDEDRLTHTIKREFIVSNVVPMTKLYTDIEYNFPELDVSVIIDKNATTDLINDVKSNDVNIRNFFRVNSMVADLNIWDTKTYVFNTTASKRVRFGSSYPSSTYNYSSAGYAGVINRISVDDQGGYYDYGGWQTSTDSKPAYDSKSATAIAPPGMTRDEAGVPSSLSYSSGGYTGTLYAGSTYSYSSEPVIEDGVASTWKYRWYRSASYSGTVTKTSTSWVSNNIWNSDYYGNYSGTVYKNVKQPYISNFSVESNKYIIYVSNTGINSQVDFDKVRSEAPEAEIYVVSNDSSSINDLDNAHYYSYEEGKTLEIIEKIVKDIKTKNPINLAYTLLPGQTFNLNYVNIDYEGDPILENNAFYYEHNQNFFDNPTGQEPGTNANAIGEWTGVVKNKFNSVGQYTIRRKVSDAPVGDELLGLESNVPEIEIIVHRKPIADYDLDWTYNPVAGFYETTWLDKSYDLDFQITDPINKGIVNRKIKYRRNGGSWIYEVPQHLLSGNYDLEYIVQDTYGAWSDVKLDSFSLNLAPGIQLMSGQVKTKLNKFSLRSIPHTEALILYDVITRYPYDHDVYYQWFSNNQAVSNKNILGPYETVGSQRLYDDFDLKIDKKLSNGTYDLKLSAEDTNKIESKIFEIKVETPLDLDSSIKEFFNAGSHILTAKTSKYVDSVSVLVFKGTDYEKQVNLSRTSDAQWVGSFDVLSQMLEGLYDFEFKASVASDPVAYETQIHQGEVKLMGVSSIDLKGDWSYYARDENIFNQAMTFNGHRFLALENLNLQIKTLGEPESIEVYLPQAFLNRYYRDDENETYDNNQWVTLMPEVFKMIKTGENTFKVSFEVPLVDSSLNTKDERLLPAYVIKIKLIKGSKSLEYFIDDVEITGNLFDHLYLQPNN